MNRPLRRAGFRGVAIVLLALAFACTKHVDPPAPADMNAIAESYVKLVLKAGQLDPNLVDAYYGDESWKPTGAPAPVDQLVTEAQNLW